MDDEKEYQTVILAALLHDIGKLLQRGSFFGSLNIKGKHPQVSSEFISAYSSFFSKVVDVELLKTLVQHHHESNLFPDSLRVNSIKDPHQRCLASLISLADNISSSERGERTEEWQDFKLTPLVTIMERIHIPVPKDEGNEIIKTSTHRFRARPLMDDKNQSFNIFPEIFDKYDEGEVNALLTAFGADFAAYTKLGDIIDYNTVLCHLMHFITKYSWCVPSNTQEDIPDISLFDHLKITAAIAACLYLYHGNNNSLTEKAIKSPDRNRFLIVTGDISGIQKYIFDISNIGTGGVARKLRSRSLFIQLITESISHKILREFGLPITNILMSAGGNFHLLLPNIPDVKTMLKTVNEDIDQWFLKNLNGEMALNLAHVELDGEGFGSSAEQDGGFGGVIRQVNDCMAKAKQQRFSSVLKNGDKWDNNQFVIEVDFKGQEACESCHKFPQDDPEEKLCKHCKLDKDIGKILPNSNIIAFFSGEQMGYIPLPYGSAALLGGIREKDNNAYLMVKLNSTDLSNLYYFPAQSKFLATYIPKVTNEEDREKLRQEPVTFERLAAKARGRSYLGFLKMDADNMGKVMVFGLKRENTELSLDTASRLATLSRQIDWFFSGWVQYLLVSQENKFNDCYTVFSGGDDLFIIGPWNKIVELANRIQVDYAKYAGNPELTISAGIIIGSSSYPISQAAEAADDALKKSKDGGRNKITLLGHTLTWAEWAEVKKKWEELDEEKISSAFLYSLLEYGSMWKDFKHGKILGLRFQPLLAYNVGRNLNPRQSPVFYQWAKEIISLKLDDIHRKQVILDNLGLIAQLLILGKGGDDK